MNFKVATLVVGIVSLSAAYGQEPSLVDRSPDRPFPVDCASLSEGDVEIAKAMVDRAHEKSFQQVWLNMLKNRIAADKLKAYAWWRWIELEIRRDGVDHEIATRLKEIPTLLLYNSADNRHGSTAFSYYVLKDGTKIMHGPCVLIETDSGELKFGEYWHGVKNGIWKEYNIRHKELGEGKEEWHFGKPFTGTFLLPFPDGALSSVTLFEGAKVDTKGLTEFKYQAKVVNLGKDEDVLKQLEERKTPETQAPRMPPTEVTPDGKAPKKSGTDEATQKLKEKDSAERDKEKPQQDEDSSRPPASK